MDSAPICQQLFFLFTKKCGWGARGCGKVLWAFFLIGIVLVWWGQSCSYQLYEWNFISTGRWAHSPLLTSNPCLEKKKKNQSRMHSSSWWLTLTQHNCFLPPSISWKLALISACFVLSAALTTMRALKLAICFSGCFSVTDFRASHSP